jgi:prevent-host-death family protein
MNVVAELLRCSHMATEIPQRDLRNRTAELLRRVEAGERLRITVHGHPVADLGPIEDEAPAGTFVPLPLLFEEMAGVLDLDDRWAEEVRGLRGQDKPVRDPFEAFEGPGRERSEDP